jgi:hypothetical protein
MGGGVWRVAFSRGCSSRGARGCARCWTYRGKGDLSFGLWEREVRERAKVFVRDTG